MTCWRAAANLFLSVDSPTRQVYFLFQSPCKQESEVEESEEARVGGTVGGGGSGEGKGNANANVQQQKRQCETGTGIDEQVQTSSYLN